MAGRKPIFKTAMTAAARMRRSRALRREALGRITDDLAQAPTALLVQALTRQIVRVHTPSPRRTCGLCDGIWRNCATVTKYRRAGND